MPAQKNCPKLDKHQDREEIDGLIRNGEQPNEISQMLKLRYPGDKKKWLLHSYLYQVRKTRYPELAKRKRMDKYERRTATGGTEGDE